MKSMRLCILSLLMGSICLNANAASQVDQQQLTSNTGIPTTSTSTVMPVGQSFTPAVSGRLTKVILSSNGGASASGTVSYSIYAGSGSGGTLLGSKTDTLAANSYDAVLKIFPVTLDTSSLNISLTAGQPYTVVLTGTTGAYTRGIVASTLNPYGAGRAYFGPGYGDQPLWDLTFITYVDTQPFTNVALGKSTSDAGGTFSSRAVDGNTDGNFNNNSVSHTTSQTGAWWEADLSKMYPIDSIVLFNRTDCCSDRLRNFNVQILDESRVVIKEFVTSGMADVQSIYRASNSKGRYVRVQLNGTDILSLAEVQVWVDSSLITAP